jgi:hypothetical protein
LRAIHAPTAEVSVACANDVALDAGAEHVHLTDADHSDASRRLERETQRNLELMWLTGRLMSDFKTIAGVHGRCSRQPPCHTSDELSLSLR